MDAPYPESKQVDAVRLVEAALTVAAWRDAYAKESLLCAADYLERQISPPRTESANAVLKAIVKHYRKETKY